MTDNMIATANSHSIDSAALALPASYVALDRHAFQRTLNGKPVDLYLLTNRNGLRVSLCNHGARIVQILTPDRHGQLGDVVLGYDSLEAILHGYPSMNAFIGRYANRIANACFTLGDHTYQLGANHQGHCLHGGHLGSRFVVFDAAQSSPQAVEMRYTFADGEEGFPGTLALTLRYTLADDNALSLEWDAITLDKPTIASFTGHAFFNLSGNPNTSIVGHHLTLAAEHFLPLDARQLPIGEVHSVAGTPFDFRFGKPLGQDIDAADEQLRHGNGYDHYFLLQRQAQATLCFAARVVEPQSGRGLEVWTSEPGLQLFSGNSLGADRPQNIGRDGVPFAHRGGLCLEPSRFPNAPNQPHFPSAIVTASKPYRGHIVYRFFSTTEETPGNP